MRRPCATGPEINARQPGPSLVVGICRQQCSQKSHGELVSLRAFSRRGNTCYCGTRVRDHVCGPRGTPRPVRLPPTRTRAVGSDNERQRKARSRSVPAVAGAWRCGWSRGIPVALPCRHADFDRIPPRFLRASAAARGRLWLWDDGLRTHAAPEASAMSGVWCVPGLPAPAIPRPAAEPVRPAGRPASRGRRVSLLWGGRRCPRRCRFMIGWMGEGGLAPQQRARDGRPLSEDAAGREYRHRLGDRARAPSHCATTQFDGYHFGGEEGRIS